MVAIVVLAFLVLLSQPVAAESVTPNLSDVGFTPHLGAAVPASFSFVDEQGQTVRLADYLGAKPVVLTFNDLECQDLCSLMLAGLAKGLAGVPYKLGGDYTAVTISIDPRDTPAIAALVKERDVRTVAGLGLAQGWHFLTGDPAGMAALTRAVGFDYAYDAQQAQFAHPTGLVILTPDGHISRYLYGIDFSSLDLRFALIDASHHAIGSPTDSVLLLCYHYDASLGRYSGIAMGWVRVGGAMTLALVVGWLGRLWWNDLRRGNQPRGTG